MDAFLERERSGRNDAEIFSESSAEANEDVDMGSEALDQSTALHGSAGGLSAGAATQVSQEVATPSSLPLTSPSVCCCGARCGGTTESGR